MRYEKSEDGKSYREVRRETLGAPVLLDGWDAAHQIGFEYISEGDYFKLGGEQSASTVQDYDFKSVAARLATDAARVKGAHIGVFYDPMTSVEWKKNEKGEYRAPRNLKGERQLRAQVRDFIAWLKSEGVL